MKRQLALIIISLLFSTTLFAQADQFQTYDKDYSQSLNYDELQVFYKANETAIITKLDALKNSPQHYEPAFLYSITKKEKLIKISMQDIKLATFALCLKNPYCKKTQLVIEVSPSDFTAFVEQLE